MIAVVDRGNERIQVFYPNGTFAAFMFGSSHGSGPIDIGPTGRVVVGRDVYDPNGTLAFRFDYGSALGQVDRLRAVAVAPDGRIVVADTNRDHSGDRQDRIQVFAPDGSFVLAFGSRTGEDRLGYVNDIAVDPHGLIAVADDPGIRFFTLGGSPLSGLLIENNCYWSSWNRVAFGPDGQIATACQYGIAVHHQVRYLNGTVSFEGNRTGYGNGSIADFDGAHYGEVDIAFGPDGRLVVTDTYTHRVSVYHPVNATRSVVQHPNGSLVPGGWFVQHPNGSLVPSGSFALGFGSYGSVSREFDSPTDVAVAPDGRIVVAEPGNYSIRAFHSNGTAALEFGSRGSGDGHFYTPRYVAVAPDGRIVVGDTGKQRVQVFTPDGSPALAFGSAGGGEGEFRGLRDVAVAPDGRIVVADEGNGRVSVFHPNGSFALAIEGSYTSWGGLVETATHVAVAPDGRIVVGDEGRNWAGVKSVRVFNPDTFHPNGSFNVDDSLIFTIPDLGGPLAVAPDGRIVVAGEDGIDVFHPDGSFAFASPVETDLLIDAVAVGPDGRIVVVDSEDNRVQVFHPDGSHAFAIRPALAEGRFNTPTAVAIGPLVLPFVAAPMDLPVVIGPSAAGLLNFTAAGDAANLTIDVAGLAGPGGQPSNGSGPITVVFPPSKTVVAASFAEVSFPPGVRASHVPADGLLSLRVAADGPTAERAQAALGRNGSEIVLLQRVVEVGAEGSRVVFDMPVRILLEGQAGGRAFWVEGAGANGTITPIDEECDAASDAAAVHAQLGGSGECQVDEPGGGGGKIVYTYHLTRFGTVSSAGPAPQPVFAGGLGAGGAGANDTAPPPVPDPPPPVPRPPAPVPPSVVHTCSVSLGSANLDLRATAGGYSDPVRQALRNTGSLALDHVELGATTWMDVGPLPAPAPAPLIPPPVVGSDAGRTSAVLTAVLVAGLPASVTEVSTDEGGAAPYAPLANGTAVAHGLEGGDEEPVWFRMNLSDRGGMQGGTFVQTITYQAQCASP